jgi:hypothetical protein
MRDHVDAIGRNPHFHVFGLLLVVEGHPGSDFLECSQPPDPADQQAHESGDQAIVSPASGLEGRPKVSVQASFTGDTVIQEKAVGASEAEVMEIVDHRDAQGEGRLVNCRRKAGEGILNHPKVKIFPGLQGPKFPGHPKVVPSLEGHGETSRAARSPESFCGAKIAFHPVGRRKGSGKKLRKSFLASWLKIPAKDLKDPQLSHVCNLTEPCE